MPAPQAPMTEAQIAARRRAARRTALVVGGIAIAIYVAFVASGVVGR
jgi:CHASE3 domain sensor protein